MQHRPARSSGLYSCLHVYACDSRYDSWSTGHQIAVEQLTSDYTNTLGAAATSGLVSPTNNEAPILFKRNGVFYLMFGECCCFCHQGSGSIVMHAAHPLGPWTQLGNGSDLNPKVWFHTHVIDNSDHNIIWFLVCLFVCLFPCFLVCLFVCLFVLEKALTRVTPCLRTHFTSLHVSLRQWTSTQFYKSSYLESRFLTPGLLPRASCSGQLGRRQKDPCAGIVCDRGARDGRRNNLGVRR